MSNEQVAPETKGVTVKLLGTVDLGPEIEGMVGRQLRMRMGTIEPGGVFGPLHAGPVSGYAPWARARLGRLVPVMPMGEFPYEEAYAVTLSARFRAG